MSDDLTATLSVPKPRFKKGDVLRLTPGKGSPNGNYDLIVWVRGVSYAGDWRFDSSTQTISIAKTRGPLYDLVVQGGVSGSKDHPRKSMRPGNYWVGYREDDDKNAFQLVTDWTTPIVSEDTIDNIHERDLAWNAAQAARMDEKSKRKASSVEADAFWENYADVWNSKE